MVLHGGVAMGKGKGRVGRGTTLSGHAVRAHSTGLSHLAAVTGDL